MTTNDILQKDMATRTTMAQAHISEAWGQSNKEPVNSGIDGYSRTWLRVLMTEALPSITSAKVTILIETAK